jgi:hypothetical protein
MMPRTLLVLLVVALAPGAAHAEQKKVLVLPFSGDLPANAPADGLARLTAVVARSGGITGAEVNVGQASFADTATLVGCSTENAECLGKVAEALGVDQVVTGTVEVTGDGDTVVVELKLFKDQGVVEKSLELPAPSFAAVIEGLARDVPALFVSERDPEPEPEPAPEPEPEPIAPPITEPPSIRDTAESSGGIGAAPWIVGAVGLAALGGGGALLYLARDRQDQVDSAPTASAADLDRLEELEDEGEQFTLAGNALLIGGGVAIAAAATLAVIRGLSGGDDDGGVALAPMALPGGAGIHLSFGIP